MISLRVKYLKSLKETSLGLIGAKKAKPVMFLTRFGIHTFGLNFPIDVLILDANNTVVKITNNLKPNRIFVWNPKYNKVIELPSGEVEKLKIKMGNKIKIVLPDLDSNED